ncbi:MAG TPA: HEAT repeat domain-containing protein, partial [Hyphomicrobiaceae bacterium]|nr:HEAT repeat domain-containing protein [Hyphomicrobiaceae bacterium]
PSPDACKSKRRGVLRESSRDGNSRAVPAPAVERLLGDPSALVRAMAVWALKRLADPDYAGELQAQHVPGEPDEQVRAEWFWPGA